MSSLADARNGHLRALFLIAACLRHGGLKGILDWRDGEASDWRGDVVGVASTFMDWAIQAADTGKLDLVQSSSDLSDFDSRENDFPILPGEFVLFFPSDTLVRDVARQEKVVARGPQLMHVRAWYPSTGFVTDLKFVDEEEFYINQYELVRLFQEGVGVVHISLGHMPYLTVLNQNSKDDMRLVDGPKAFFASERDASDEQRKEARALDTRIHIHPYNLPTQERKLAETARALSRRLMESSAAADFRTAKFFMPVHRLFPDKKRALRLLASAASGRHLPDMCEMLTHHLQSGWLPEDHARSLVEMNAGWPNNDIH